MPEDALTTTTRRGAEASPARYPVGPTRNRGVPSRRVILDIADPCHEVFSRNRRRFRERGRPGRWLPARRPGAFAIVEYFGAPSGSYRSRGEVSCQPDSAGSEAQDEACRLRFRF
jgi:hypothetical protein